MGGRSTVRFKHPEGARELLAPRDALTLARSTELSRVGGWLLELLGKASSFRQHRMVKPVQLDADAWEQGYALGAAARDSIHRSRQPISNIQILIESIGVHLAFVELESDIVGASIYEPGGLPIILLNRNASRIRSPLSRRAAIAHELCHLLHDGGERDLLVVSMTYTPDSFEQRANGFAPAFIAHPHAVRSDYESALADGNDHSRRAVVMRLAGEWGFTAKGAIWHLKNCRLISSADAERLQQDRWPSIEPALPFESGTPRLPIPESISISDLVYGYFSDLVAEALRLDEISEERAEELLSL